MDENLWFNLNNGLLAWEVVFVVLFNLGGELLCPSPVLSPPKEKGYCWGALTKVMFCSPPYLTLSILEPIIVN